MERLVSLAPAATSTLSALGVRDRLVGVTVQDDVDGVPAIGGWLNPDLDRVEALEPDLVLTSDALQREVRDAVVERGHEAFHRVPATLEDVEQWGLDATAHVVDDSLLNQPSPRLIDGVELVAERFHGEARST